MTPTPEERAAQVEFRAEKGSVNLLGGWELDEDGTRAQIADIIRDAERDMERITLEKAQKFKVRCPRCDTIFLVEDSSL